MPKLLTIVGSVLLAIAASVAACTDGAQETQRDDDASAFAREVVGVLEQVQLAHDALSDLGLEDLSASQQEARYSDLEAEMRLARGRIDDADARRNCRRPVHSSPNCSSRSATSGSTWCSSPARARSCTASWPTSF